MKNRAKCICMEIQLSYNKHGSDYIHASWAFLGICTNPFWRFLSFFFCRHTSPSLCLWPRDGAECYLITCLSDSNTQPLLWGSLILPGSPSNFFVQDGPFACEWRGLISMKAAIDENFHRRGRCPLARYYWVPICEKLSLLKPLHINLNSLYSRIEYNYTE